MWASAAAVFAVVTCLSAVGATPAQAEEPPVSAGVAAPVSEVTWTGRLLTSDGVAVSGVDVSLSPRSEQGISVCGRNQACTVSRTDAQGRFSLTVEGSTDANPISYQLRLERVAGSQARAGDVVIPSFSMERPSVEDLVADRTQDITLPALVKVTARVEDASGAAVAGAEVGLPAVDQSDEPPMTGLFWSPAVGAESSSTRTDAQGEASFYTFGSSTPLYVATAFRDGSGRSFSVFRAITVADTDDALVIRQPEAATWSGQVLTTDGLPVSGVDVSAVALSPGGHPLCGAEIACAVSRTGADGRFAVTVEATSDDNPVSYGPGLSRAPGAEARVGEVVVPVFSVGLGSVTEFASDHFQDLTLPSLVKVTVHTVDAQGAAIPSVELRLPDVDQSDEPPMRTLYWTPAALEGEATTTHTDAQGEATFYSFSSPVPLVVEARFPVAGGEAVTSYRQVVADSGEAELTIEPPSRVTLSGRVLTADGLPVSGVDVSLSVLTESGRRLCGEGRSCTVSRTDSQGAYSLTAEAQVPGSPTHYELAIDRVAGAQARAGGVVMPVFSFSRGLGSDLVQDQTQDVILPALVRVVAHVQDAQGASVRGVALNLLAVDQSDEPPMTALYWSPAGAGGESAAALTDAQGDATFYSFSSSTPLQVRADFPTTKGTLSIYRAVVAETDSAVVIQAPEGYGGEADSDDVSDSVEDNVPSLDGGGTGDGNGDGLLDSQQSNVASLPSYGATGEYVTIATPQGTALADVLAVDPTSVPAPPVDIALPTTLTSFVVTGLASGTRDETVSIYVSSTEGVVGYAKYDEGTGWTLLPNDRVSIVDAHRIDITLTDGGVGDADGVVNGSIDDPGGPVRGALASGTPTVSDTTPAVGQQLQAMEGTWGGPQVVFSYQWLRTTPSGVSADIPGATTREYTVTADDLDCTLQVRVTGSSGGYLASTRTSAATARVKAGELAPTPAPSLDSTTPVTDQVVAVQPAIWGPDGVTVSYQWYRKSVWGMVKPIRDATASTYQVRAGDVGYRLQVKVTGSLAGYTPVSRYSMWSSRVALASFISAPTPSVGGVVRVGMPLKAITGTWDPEASFAYQWYRVNPTGGCSAIPGATEETYMPTPADLGKKLRVRVTGHRPGYVASTRYSALTGAVQPGMSGGTPRVSGNAVVDQELTVSEGRWSPDQVTFSYQWYATSPSGELREIPGATGRSYRIEGQFVGHRLRVVVTGHATGYAPLAQTSAYTWTIEKATFASQPRPTVVGTARVGQTLSVVEGSWQPTPAFSYQWYRAGSAIGGASRSTYTLVSADIGKAITVRVTAALPGYAAASTTSTPTAPVAP